MDPIELDAPARPNLRLEPPPRGKPSSPEGRLMLAVLAQAIDDLWRERRYVRWRRRYRRATAILSARAWFEGGDSPWPFSFERVCESLDLDAAAVRRAVAVTQGSSPRGVTRDAVPATARAYAARPTRPS